MGPGSVYATVDDLAKWMRNFKTAEVGGADAVSEIMRPDTPILPGEQRYGLGLTVEEINGLKTVGHGGADNGHRTHLFYFPDIDAGVIAMGNDGGFYARWVAEQTAEAFFADSMTFDEKDGPAIESTDGETPENVDTSILDAQVGKYELDDVPGVVIEISKEDGVFYVRAVGDDPQPTVPVSTTTLKLGTDILIEFDPDESGVSQTMSIVSDEVQKAHRLDPWTPSEEDLSIYTGRYFCEELETFYSVDLEEGSLVIRHRRLEDIILSPSEKDKFVGEFPVANADFHRNEAGKVIGLNASNFRTRNVWFEKQAQ